MTSSHVHKGAAFLLFSFFFVEFFCYLFAVPYLVRNAAFLVIGFSSFLLCAFHRTARVAPFCAFVFGYTFCWVFSMLYNHNSNLQEILWPAGFFGVGLLTLNFRVPLKLFKFIFYSFSLVFLVIISYVGDVDAISFESSRNTISIMELQSWTLLVLAAYEAKEDVKIWTVLTGFLVCFLAVGRSGILTFGILIILFSLFSFKKGRVHLRKARSFIIAGVVIAAAALVLLCFFPSFVSQTLMNFSRRGMESVRTEIWKDYLGKTKESILNVLLGPQISGTVYLDRFNDNLHNSFLALHSKYGIIMLLTVIVLLFNSIRTLIKRKMHYLIAPIIAIFFRMNFDYTNFNSLLDINMIFYLLLPYYADNIMSSFAVGVVYEGNKNGFRRRTVYCI